MTKAPVTITYGHGKLYDCTDADALLFTTKIEDGQTLAGLVCLADDYFDIQATVSAGNKSGYYANAANLGLSTTSYKYIMFRYKCGDGSVKAKVTVEFSDASTQDVLAETNSTTWKVVKVALTAAKTLDHIRLHCNAATGHVYYDFALVYKDTFSFPNTEQGVSFKPMSRYANIGPPGMVGAFEQNLGNELAEFDIGCNLDIGTWTRTGDTVAGEVFVDIVHNSYTESWQWIDLGDLVAQFKAILKFPELLSESRGEGAAKHLMLHMSEFRRSNAVDSSMVETYVSRFGLDL